MLKLVRIACAGVAAMTLAACGSSGSGSATATPTPSSAASATSSSATSTSSAPSSSSSSSSTSTSSSAAGSATASSGTGGDIEPGAAELGARLIQGLAEVTSMHGELAASAAGEQVTATFDQLVSNGVASALSMDLQQSGQAIKLIYADDKLYFGGDAATPYSGGKEWVELSENTQDPTLKQAYASFKQTTETTGAQQYVEFLKLAKNVKVDGTEQVNGVDAEKYTFDIDLTQLDSGGVSDATKESLQVAASAGVTTIPCTFWVDADGRIQKVEQSFTIQGQTVETTITFSKYNEPVEIVAPDPATVATP